MDCVRDSPLRERTNVWRVSEDYDVNQEPLATCTFFIICAYIILITICAYTILIICAYTILIPSQLKKEYEIMKDIRNQSRWGWDNENNVPEVPLAVWEEYLAVSISPSPK
jgi:hypothetical protein